MKALVVVVVVAAGLVAVLTARSVHLGTLEVMNN